MLDFLGAANMNISVINLIAGAWLCFSHFISFNYHFDCEEKIFWVFDVIDGQKESKKAASMIIRAY